MPTDADRILHKAIDKLVKGGNFSAAAAADAALKPIAALDKLRPIDIPNLKPLVYDGLKHRAQRYQPALNKMVREALKSAAGNQTDMSEVSQDFIRLINAPAAMDEQPDTTRLPPIDMTLEQLRAHIALKRRKAGQTWRNADLLDRIIARHLVFWSANPNLTLGEILRRGEAARATAA